MDAAEDASRRAGEWLSATLEVTSAEILCVVTAAARPPDASPLR